MSLTWKVLLWSSSGEGDAPFMDKPFDMSGIPSVPRVGDELQMDRWWFIVEEVIYRPLGDDECDLPYVYVGATARRMGQPVDVDALREMVQS